MLSLTPPTPQSAILAAAQKPSMRHDFFDCRRTASEVFPRVYLTDLFTASNETHLSALGITHVVSVLEHAPMFPPTHSLQKLHIPLSDSSDADILTHLPSTTSFIQDALAESPDSRVMVSASDTAMRYLTDRSGLVATAKMTPDEALVAVKAKRGIVCPNLGFRRQLEAYANQLTGEESRANPRRAKIGGNVAEAIRKLTGKVQKEPNTGSSSPTLTISDVTSASS
ncbi:protein-tyrosine phosphatase-like protein [Lactarius quietus]|nr:protein-tyrosine phosphatase-like protein [Lactarius quietus]